MPRYLTRAWTRLLAATLLVGRIAASDRAPNLTIATNRTVVHGCPSTSDCVECTQSTYRCGFAWTSKCYCEMESCGSCDTGSSGDGDRSPDADGRCTGSCAPPPPPDPCATNDGGCNGVPLYADTHCVNVNWVADCQCNAGFQSVRSSGQDVCIPVDAGTLSCQDMQHFAEVVNRVCPAAGAGQNVPASCPELCGTVFTAWCAPPLCDLQTERTRFAGYAHDCYKWTGGGIVTTAWRQKAWTATGRQVPASLHP